MFPNPLVSIVVALYKFDNPRHFSQCLTSLDAQSYSNIEIVISLDGPVGHELLSIIPKNSKYVVVESQVNKGPAHARNLAIKKARGHYIAILDADDWSVSDRIKIQIEYMLSNPEVDLLGSGYYEVDDNGRIVGEKLSPVGISEIAKSISYFNPINNSTVLVKASVIKNIPYPNSRFGEDYRLWIRFISQGLVINNLKEKLVFFRVNDDFYSKRSGFNWAISDFKNKLLCLKFSPYKNYMGIVFFAVISFLLRLLPSFLLRYIYIIKKVYLKRKIKSES